MKPRWVTLLLICLLQSACATVTGPEITSEEEKEARTLLPAEVLEILYSFFLVFALNARRHSDQHGDQRQQG